MILTWRDWVIDEAMSWNHTPYHHKGRVKGVGTGCGGFLYEVFSPLIPGILPFPKHYAQDWALHKNDELYLNFISKYFDEIDKDERGDVLVLQIGLNYSHGMLNIGNNKYIHAWGMTGSGSVRISNAKAVVIAARQKLEFKLSYSLKKQWRDISVVKGYTPALPSLST